ncbi:MAG: DUF3237 domain-containing protein [Betaproteobacteria bacterium]|jgi:hypothetical protein|nr:DUF3237 domain-containing protein [Betaproteobacteria bacterium]
MNPVTRPLIRLLRAELADIVDVGVTPMGHRRVVNIQGGHFEGDLISGTVLPGGADWQWVRTDGTIDLDARYTLKTDAGELIQVTSQGLRTASPDVLARLGRGEDVDPALYYFRTVMRFETSAPALLPLTRLLAVAYGRRTRNAVELRVDEIL